MQKIDNPELSRKIITHLADLYKIRGTKREGIHLSTLIYCLTRSFFDQQAPVEPTDMEVMLFALGLGLQDVLTPGEAFSPIYEHEGITFSPDFEFILEDGGTTCELKTTRMSSSKEDLPETWIEYIKGGCWIRQINSYELSVLHMLGNYKPPFPEIKSYRLEFDEDELKNNWLYLMQRKAIYEEALAASKPPVPFSYCKDWECKNCRYKLQCQAIAMVGKQETDRVFEEEETSA